MKTTILFPLLFLVFHTSAQIPFHPGKHYRANPLLLQNFLTSRCYKVDTWQQHFQYQHLLYLPLGPIYDAHVFHQQTSSNVDSPSRHPLPYLILFTPENQPPTPDSLQFSPLYILSKGFSHGQPISLPINWSGHYYIAILDQQKPSLFTLDTTSNPATLKYRQPCALDLSSALPAKPGRLERTNIDHRP